MDTQTRRYALRLSLGFALALGLAGCSGSEPANGAPDGAILLPTASVTIAPGGSVTFQGACTDPDGDPVTHRWTFGNGLGASTLQSPGAVLFAAAGTYTVTYTCTDSKGLADPAPETRTINVSGTNHAPNVTITLPAASTTIALGSALSFEGACTDPDGDAVTHAWNFGGGATNSTLASPGPTTFANAGTFAVTYTCTDSKGLADPTPATRTITVGAVTSRTLTGTATFD